MKTRLCNSKNPKILKILILTFYSLRKLSTGLAKAALTL